MPNQPQEELLVRLAASWPVEWQTAVGSDVNPLRYEIAALRAGEVAHLPFFHGPNVAWLTVAGTAVALRTAVTGLRAWIIPSFAWEDRVRPIVQPANYSGPLAAPLAAVSPAGYYRWHSTAAAARGCITERLVLWRKLQSLRPASAATAEPSLFELREQFQLALATRDRVLAEAAITALDELQLDTAANTSFMRTRMRAYFGAHAEIVQDPNLSRMLALRLPRVVRTAITEAFYHVYVRDHAVAGQVAAACAAVAEYIVPQIAGLLVLARPEDGEGTSWILDHLPAKTAPEGPASQEQEFFGAIHRCDWRGAQEVGMQLLSGVELQEALRPLLQMGLAESLKHRPDATVRAAVQGTIREYPTPQGWPQFVLALRSQEFTAAEAFLELPERPELDPANGRAATEVIVAVVELLTAPQTVEDSRTTVVLHHGLACLVEDLVGDRSFPRCELAEAYLDLLRAWVATRRGSTLPADSNVAVSLAAGVLQCSGNEEAEVATLLRTWWDTRPIKAKLPFLLNALEVLGEYTTQSATAQGLWVDGVTFIRSRAVAITPTEARLWRVVGTGLGFDWTTIDEYVPFVAKSDEHAPEDPLATSGLRKVAIVSLHDRAARAAADIIQERSGAQVVVVDEVVAGAATDSAHSADVILLVWAATKHAVYRAFDDVRDKIAYVQGTGMSSIILALERWLNNVGVVTQESRSPSAD